MIGGTFLPDLNQKSYKKYIPKLLYITGGIFVIIPIIFGNFLIDYYCKTKVQDWVFFIFSFLPEDYGNLLVFIVQSSYFSENMMPITFHLIYVLIIYFLITGFALIVLGLLLNYMWRNRPKDSDQQEKIIEELKINDSFEINPRLKQIWVNRPYLSPLYFILALFFVPYLITGFPRPENYDINLYVLYFFCFIFSTFLLVFILSVKILKTKYQTSLNSLETIKKGKFRFDYVTGLSFLSILPSLPLLICFVLISDWSLGGFCYCIGLFLGLLLSIIYLEGPFRKLEKKGNVLLLFYVLENNMILTDKKLPAYSEFKIYGKNFTKIKKSWFSLLWYCIFPPIFQSNMLSNDVCNLLIYETFWIIYVLIYFFLFLRPFKKVQNVDWILKIFYENFDDLKSKFKRRIY